MKHLLTISALLISSLAMGQWPSLPYNPDDNADGLIGVADLQALLANYGSEFSSAIVSEDGESAIVYMGEMGYPLCAMSCKNLPGIWSLTTLDDLGLVWDELTIEISQASTWIEQANTYSTPYDNVLEYLTSGNSVSEGAFVGHTDHPGRLYRCYCAAKQLPRVEYSQCSNCVGNLYGTPSAASIEGCCNQKVAEGWYPLGGTSPSGASYPCISQSFWRWAQ